MLCISFSYVPAFYLQNLGAELGAQIAVLRLKLRQAVLDGFKVHRRRGWGRGQRRAEEIGDRRTDISVEQRQKPQQMRKDDAQGACCPLKSRGRPAGSFRTR